MTARSPRAPRPLKLALWSLTLGAALTAAAFWGQAEGTEEVATDAAAASTKQATLSSIGALALGPDGVLFAADPEGAAVWALEVGTPKAATGEPLTRVEEFDSQLAALLGVGPRDLAIGDMVVHQATGTAYLSLTRGKGEKARPALLTIGRDGTLGTVDLAKVKKSRLAIENAPSPDGVTFGRRSARTYTVTDLEFLDGELYIAGLSNEEFASTLRRSPYPFEGSVKTTGLEIYHGAHGEYETHAPIFSFIPLELAGKTHLLAGYLCTPLVTFPLDDVKTKERLRGKTIAELGWGNIPTDLVLYHDQGEDWVMVNNTSRGVMKMKVADVAAAHARPGITTQVGPREGIEDHSVPVGAVLQMAALGKDHILLLSRSTEDGSLYLRAREVAWT